MSLVPPLGPLVVFLANEELRREAAAQRAREADEAEEEAEDE